MKRLQRVDSQHLPNAGDAIAPMVPADVNLRTSPLCWQRGRARHEFGVIHLLSDGVMLVPGQGLCQVANRTEKESRPKEIRKWSAAFANRDPRELRRAFDSFALRYSYAPSIGDCTRALEVYRNSVKSRGAFFHEAEALLPQIELLPRKRPEVWPDELCMDHLAKLPGPSPRISMNWLDDTPVESIQALGRCDNGT